MTFDEWKKGKPEMVLLSTAEDAYEIGYMAGEKAIACCGACAHWDNIGCTEECWTCTHVDNNYDRTIDDICKNFEPRRKR